MIPDELTGSNSLLLVRFKIYNENGVGQAGEKYLLLNGAFQCEELLDKISILCHLFYCSLMARKGLMERM